MENHVKDFILIFTSILYEAMPFIVLGAVVAGILEELVPQRVIARLIPRSRVLAIGIGALLGLLFPMCECGIIPVMRRLLRKGVPLSCCVSYLLAGPIINVVVMLSTFVAFSGMETLTDTSGHAAHQFGGVMMMSMRMSLGFLVACGTALIVEWQHRKHGNRLLAPLAIADTKAAEAGLSDNDEDAPKLPWSQKIGNVAETALHDFVDITVYLIIGGLVAALSRQLLDRNQVEALSLSKPYLAILAMMGLAIVLCLCSEADAFVAASYVMVRPAAKLAFLVLGPMLDFKLYMMYTRVFRPRLIWTIILSVVVQVFIYAMLVHFVWESYWAAHPAAAQQPTAAATAAPGPATAVPAAKK